MKGAEPRCLIAVAVAAVIAIATPADAEPSRRSAQDASSNIANPPTKPAPRITRAANRESRRAWTRDDFSRVIAEAATQHAVPERLIWAVIRVESGFDHRAVSRKGARGLMQLMPATAARLGVRDAFDPYQNIHGGTRHLRAMMERFPYDLHLAIAAYNAGDGAVVAFGGIPPYRETRDYVSRVLSLYAVPLDCCQSIGSGIHRFIRIDGTVTYTNVPMTRVSALAEPR